jgi:Secretion system C-terminal sorting domain/PKD-like domain
MLLFCSAIIIGFSAKAQNNVPSFVNGYAQAISVCENSAATPIDTAMAVNDADAGQTESWIITTAPSNGSVGGFFTSMMSTGSTIYPTGLSYTPTTGFTGRDSFTVQIFDGFDTATTTVFVTVYGLPTLSSTTAADTICNGTIFNYAPTSSFSGTTFNWKRLFTGAISNPLSSGTNNPMEFLNNTSYYTVPVTYAYTLTANGCSNTENVLVNVNPTPTLTSDATDTICSGATFHYVPTGLTPGTTYMYSRDRVTGITPDTASGSGTINETLVNSSLTIRNAVYIYTLTANGCMNADTVTVTVNPEPAMSAITTTATGTLCSGTNNQLFGAATAPSTGVKYTWSATNAVINATGNNGQYSIISFPNSGTATITLTATIAGSGCISHESVNVTVSSSMAPSAKVVYYNQQFIYMDNNIDSYQWGYDDAGTFASTVLTGQVFQSYPITNPDMVNRYYWVKTSRNGCVQKTYYNTLLAVSNVQPGNANITVTPNPASGLVTVSISGAQGNTTEVAIVNMLGQTLKTLTASARNINFDVADMPAGCYLVNCAQDGVKIATARFIKN